MKDLFTKIIALARHNWIITALVGFFLFVTVFRKQAARLFRTAPRRRRRRTATRPVRRSPVRRSPARRSPVRRSPVPSRRGYPAAGGGIIPFKYNKDGTVKKAWQVGGTLAAKQRMSRLRKAR